MNRYYQLSLVLIIVTLASGCGTYNRSLDSYGSNATVAIVHAHNPGQKNIEYGTFQSIDGKRLKCKQGCPQSVRVPPGEHTFIVKVKSSSSNEDGATYSFEAEITVSLNNMEAGKIYVVNYVTNRQSQRLSARIDVSPNLRPNLVNTSGSDSGTASNSSGGFSLNKRGSKFPKKSKFSAKSPYGSSQKSLRKKSFLPGSKKASSFTNKPKSMANSSYDSAKNKALKKQLPDQGKLLKKVKPKWKPF